MHRRLKFAVGAAALVVGVLAIAIVFPRPLPSSVVVPPGTYALGDRLALGSDTFYWTGFTHGGRETAAYRVTGSWVASGPAQVIIAEEFGPNFGGCGFLPLNLPPGGLASGCWPTFGGSTGGSVDETFHVCVGPTHLSTGSFVVIFRSRSPAVVTVTDPFVVDETTFPQADCP